MDKPFLTVKDLMAMFGREQAIRSGRNPDLAKPLSRSTIASYMHESRPATPGQGRARRYEHMPMPSPTYLGDNRMPVWIPADGETVDGLKRRLVAWWHDRQKPRGRPRAEEASGSGVKE